MSDLTSDFIENQFKILLYEFTALNSENNVTIPVVGVFIKNICDALIDIGNDIQMKYGVVVYNPFQSVDAYFQTNPLYTNSNLITLQTLNQLDALLDNLTNAINYMNQSSYNNNLLNQLPGYISRLQYIIQYITVYTNGVSSEYSYTQCDSRNKFQYGFNYLKIYGGVN